MIKTQDIHSLSDFQRNTKKHIKRLAKTGRPEVLTLNGQATVIVQDAAAYQKLMDELDLAASSRLIAARLASYKKGRGVPAADAVEAIRKTLRLEKE